MSVIWLKFLISAVVIVVAGIRLTESVDQFSDCLQIGKVWIGVVLLGFITSLPEMITSLVAVVSLHAGDLAVGNILGSNNFNPMLLVVMDFFYRKGSITNVIHSQRSHNASAGFAVLLTGGVILGIIFKSSFATSILIALGYFAGMYYLAKIEKEDERERESFHSKENYSLVKMCFNIGISAVAVIGASIFLTGSADALADQTGLGRTFVGSIFLALVTSLPEMVISLSALKIGAFDLAIGNIFGSNMTNIFIVSICNIFYRGGNLLNEVSHTHILTAVLSILLTGMVIAGIHFKNKKTFLGLGIDSYLMTGLFIVGTKVLYYLR